jgi:hypothetical protein
VRYNVVTIEALWPTGLAYVVLVPAAVALGSWWAYRHLWKGGPSAVRRSGRWVTALGLTLGAVTWMLGSFHVLVHLLNE